MFWFVLTSPALLLGFVPYLLVIMWVGRHLGLSAKYRIADNQLQGLAFAFGCAFGFRCLPLFAGSPVVGTFFFVGFYFGLMIVVHSAHKPPMPQETLNAKPQKTESIKRKLSLGMGRTCRCQCGHFGIFQISYGKESLPCCYRKKCQQVVEDKLFNGVFR